MYVARVLFRMSERLQQLSGYWDNCRNNSLFAIYVIILTWLSLRMTLSATLTLKLYGILVTVVGRRRCGGVVEGSSKPGGSLMQVSSRGGPLRSQGARSGPCRCWGISFRLLQLRSGASVRDTDLIAKSRYMPGVPGICTQLTHTGREDRG